MAHMLHAITGLHSKRLFFYMSGNLESETSFLDVILGFEYFSRQRAPAGHFPLPPHQFVFEIGLWYSTFVAKNHMFRMFRGRPFQYFLFKHQKYRSYSPAEFLVIPSRKKCSISLDIFLG